MYPGRHILWLQLRCQTIVIPGSYTLTDRIQRTILPDLIYFHVILFEGVAVSDDYNLKYKVY